MSPVITSSVSFVIVVTLSTGLLKFETEVKTSLSKLSSACFQLCWHVSFLFFMFLYFHSTLMMNFAVKFCTQLIKKVGTQLKTKAHSSLTLTITCSSAVSIYACMYGQ